jgi:hypothetical protein
MAPSTSITAGHGHANIDQDNLTKKFEYSGGNLIYEGMAAPGSATSDAVWRIRKFTYDGSNNVTDIQFAGGKSAFNQVWDDHAAASYS